MKSLREKISEKLGFNAWLSFVNDSRVLETNVYAQFSQFVGSSFSAYLSDQTWSLCYSICSFLLIFSNSFLCFNILSIYF